MLRPGAVAERVAVLDGLWGTRLFMEGGAADLIVASIERQALVLVELFGGLSEDDLERNRERVWEAAGKAMPSILSHSSGTAERFRENYSFATKFFHWCTRFHFPIVDSKARKRIYALQENADVKPRVRSTAAAMNGLEHIEEYNRWIDFYSDLIGGLTIIDRERLCRADYDSQPIACRVKNSVLRILDKVFYFQGGGSGMGRVSIGFERRGLE